MIKKVKNTALWTKLLMVLKVNELLERFTKKNYKKKNQKEFTIEKIIKRKSDKC